MSGQNIKCNFFKELLIAMSFVILNLFQDLVQ